MNVLFELKNSLHIQQRKNDRFNKNRPIDIGYNDETHKGGDFVFVGKGYLSDNQVNTITNNLNILTKTDFPLDKSYAVKLADIKPDINMIEYYDGFGKHNVSDKRLYFVHRQENKNSGGNSAYIIIRNNDGITIMYVKNDLITPNTDVNAVYTNIQDFINKESTMTQKQEVLKEYIKRFIIKEEFENEEPIDEAEYPTAFNMDTFKSLKSFKEREAYCNEKLKRISSGSARIVYLIDPVTVLKLAKNQKGIAQNRVEAEYTNYLGSTVSEVLDSHPDDLWVESQFAKKLTPSRFRQLTGFDVNTVGNFIRNYEAQYNGKKPIFSIDKNIESEMWEDEFISGLRDIVDQGLSAGDLGRVSSYGELNNNVVVVDYGINDDVLSTYYKR